MKKVSIVVPCYNVAQYLDRCVESLVNQTIGIENLEIILVDDASTDAGRTWDRITETEKRFPDSVLAVSLSENLRQGGARNVGISYAGGEYLMFCDADDRLVLEAAECLYERAAMPMWWNTGCRRYGRTRICPRYRQKKEEEADCCFWIKRRSKKGSI